jgi:hypothetical protein
MRRSHIGDVLAAVALGMALVPARASGQTIDELKRELESMKQLMRSMQQRLERQEATIKRLEARTPPAAKAKVAEAPRPAPDAARALDEAVAQVETEVPAPAPTAPPALLSGQVGSTTFRLIDVSFDILTAAGASTADDDEIAVLQGGGHDPERRGFTLQQGELSLAGAVDPYFTGQAHVIFTDEVIELEEAFLTTQRLPYGLQLKAGHFLTEFGRLNPTHPHAWQWIDQAVINTRLLGGDGLRNPGFRLAWLLPIPWFSQIQLGAQDASGETALSFLGDGEDTHGHGHDDEEEPLGIGRRPIVERSVHDLGDLLYLARWEHGFSLTSSVEAKLGGSALFGPNASGPHGRTRIYGGDAVVKWRPSDNFRGWPFFTWETEVMARDFDADAVREADVVLPSTTLHDWGLYTQLLYGFAYRWATGVRYEYATGSGASVGGRAADPFRDDRHRVAPLLWWRPTEFSRLRLQYNFDHAQHLDDDAHSVWLGIEVLYGAHPAHDF